MNTRILIWETDVVWAEELKRILRSAGMNCQEVDFMEEYKRLSYSSRYSACILGWGTLKERVAETTETYSREEYWENVWMRLNAFCQLSPLPVVLMVEEQQDAEEIQAFRSGVSDYIVKGRDSGVCVARVQAAIRSWNSPARQKEVFVLDQASHQMIIGGVRIRLTNREYGVLAYLYENYNQAVNREAILEHVWNISGEKNKRVVDTVVKQLRHKLETTPYEIHSVYKLGYQLQKREAIKYNFRQSGEMEEHP